MKINLIHLVFISLILAGVTSPALVHSESADIKKINLVSTNSTNKHKTPNTNRMISNTAKLSDRKDILIDDSRGLSAFFIFGIIINIIMAVTFGWWFSKEWRRAKK